jgi:hypothetical protein
MRVPSARYWLIVLAGILVDDYQVLAQQPNSPDIQTILQAWKKRQEQVRSLKIVCKGKKTRSKLDITGPDSDGVHDVPEEGFTFDSERIIRLCGDKLHFEEIGKSWDGDRRELEPSHWGYAFDGNNWRLLFHSFSESRPSGGSVYNKDSRIPYNTVVLPVLLLYRPYKSEWAFHPERFQVTQTNVVIRGVRCVQLEAEIPREKSVEWIWVDPEKQFLIQRYAKGTPSSIHFQIDFQYKKFDSNEWVVSGWEHGSYLGNTTVIQSFRGIVTECKMNRGDDHDCLLTFPPGTWVTDYTKTSAEGNYSTYLIKRDGSNRPILESEIRSATYEQLMNSDPGTIFSSSSFNSKWLYIPVLFSVPLVLLALRRICRSRERPSSTKGD